MENLTEKENELRKLAEGGNYWDILNLADFLADNGKYEEAEEWYLEIAGEDDFSGDANAHYSHMLLDMERYDEAIEYYKYVLECSDTSPREGIYIRIEEFLFDIEAPIWKKISPSDFNELIACHSYIDLSVVEKILLNRANNKDDEIRKHAMRELLMIYLEGCYYVGVSGCETIGDDCSKNKNIEKAIERSIVFAEYPELIDEVYVDWGYFYTALDYIWEDYKGNSAEYVKRLVITALNRAEELGNIEDVLNTIESNLISFYDACVPFYLGYIPKGINYVPTIAFSSDCCDNQEIESVVVPDTIKMIKANAFLACKVLKSVEISSSVIVIEEYAFSCCSSLASIIIPKSVVEIGYSVFEGCDSLATIYCEVESKPDGWADEWLGDCEAEIIWGYKK